MSKAKVALGAAFGAVAGFITGVLVAPKSGKEARQDIHDAALRSKDTIVEKAEEAKDFAEVKAKQAKEKADEVIGEVTDKAVEYKNRAEQAVEGAKKGFAKKPSTKKK